MKDINFKKLFFELVVIMVLALASSVTLVCSATSKHNSIIGDEYAKYRSYVEFADNYSYEKGRDHSFEERIDSLYEKSEETPKFFYGVASATYYCNIGFYRNAKRIYSELEEIAPNEEELTDMLVRKVLCERRSDGKE